MANTKMLTESGVLSWLIQLFPHLLERNNLKSSFYMRNQMLLLLLVDQDT